MTEYKLVRITDAQQRGTQTGSRAGSRSDSRSASQLMDANDDRPYTAAHQEPERWRRFQKPELGKAKSYGQTPMESRPYTVDMGRDTSLSGLRGWPHTTNRRAYTDLEIKLVCRISQHNHENNSHHIFVTT